MSFIIVGLGNPGEKYKFTRHNAGRLILQRLAAENFTDLVTEPWREKKNPPAKIAAGRSVAGLFQFILPETYMNLTGEVFKKIPGLEKPADLIVLHDELALPLGQFRLSFGRGAGGHNGVKSIITALGTKDFLRLRVGIGQTGAALSRHWLAKLLGLQNQGKNYVLEKFNEDELNKLINLIPKIKEALLVIMDKGKEAAMNRFN